MNLRVHITCFVIALSYRKLAQSTTFHQDDYEIVHDSVEIPLYNKEIFIEPPYIALFKYNETLRMKAVNMSGNLYRAAQQKIIMKCFVFKFVKNAYRRFPFDLTVELCDAYRKIEKENIFGLQAALKYSNFKGCPIPPGLLYSNLFIMDDQQFPPHLPLGKYKLDVHIDIDADIFFCKGTWFGSLISRK